MSYVPYLLRVGWKPGFGGAHLPPSYPFSVPAIRTLESLDLGARVVFFVGENGSGKSTLLEAIAISTGLFALGGDEAWNDASLEGPRQLTRALALTWSRRTHEGFYLRAEDFFGYLKRRARNDAELTREEAEAIGFDRPGLHGEEAASARWMRRHDARSHGESFLDTFLARMEDGLYLLDEPEAPLSPQRQLALLTLIDDAVRRGGQCVIATHSPILLGYPGARIYSFDEGSVREVAYDELPHVTLTREFLAAPERFFKYL